MALQELLDAGCQYGAEYKRGLSNHLPMALIALERLGADTERLSKFAEFYATRLEPMPPAEDISVSTANWAENLGNHRHNRGYVDFFGAELRRLGRTELLASYLPKLIRGVAGGAFHPLIRLAYALDADLDSEVVHALAAWAIAYLELGEPPAATGLPLFDQLERLRSSPLLRDFKPVGPNIFSRLALIGEHSAFSWFGGVPPGTDLTTVREAALAIYAGSGDNFTALHLVTATHALRLVVQEVPTLTSSVTHFWRAVGAAYVSIKMPKPKGNVPLVDVDWETIAPVACASNDDHVIKFVYTCREEERAYSDPRYRALAAAKASV